MNDAILLEGLKQKDRKAFNALFDLLFAPLCHFTEQIIKDEIEAEDIAIHSFAKFWEHGGAFHSVNEVKGFIYTVARNAAFDYLKKIKVQQSYQCHIAYVSSEAEEMIADRALYEVEMLERLFQEIEQLPAQCREAFKLTYINRLPRTVVAEKLHISVGTVHVHCSHAIKKLREKFSEKELLLLLLVVDLCKN